MREHGTPGVVTSPDSSAGFCVGGGEMAALWEQKADVRTSIRDELDKRIEAMNRKELETFAVLIAGHLRLAMTLSELQDWDTRLKSIAK